ncbi:MAG: hypothetical protein QXQ18_01560 [Candidatus Aenigmatarchaeota archaeon]
MTLAKLEKLSLQLNHPFIFKNFIRPWLYRKNNNDVESVHEYILKFLNELEVLNILEKKQKEFYFEELEITINGKKIIPLGTAAGFDKNCEALLPLSYVFGFQEVGTIVVNFREGNPKPRVTTDAKKEAIYNAQGFPSKGVEYSLRKLREFRKKRPEYPIYANICGIPNSEKELDKSLDEVSLLIDKLNPYVDGFVWNPSSPNTEILKFLRTQEMFKKHAEIMKQKAPDKLKLVKIGPYDKNEEGKKESLSLIEAFVENGGNGIVGVNTYRIPYNWPYKSAGVSGRPLAEYRLRAVKDARERFPDIIIFATGGIFDVEDAYRTIEAGANVLQFYTPLTFYGFGLVKKIGEGLIKKLKENGYTNLEKLKYARQNFQKINT